MANTEQATEPTMEEILSSIRRIISDETETDASDGNVKANETPPKVEEAVNSSEETASEPEPEPEPESDPEPEPEPAPEPETVADEAEAETVSEESQDEDDDIFDLTDVVDESVNEDQPEEEATEELELVEPEPDPAPEFNPEPKPVAESPTPVEPEPMVAASEPMVATAEHPPSNIVGGNTEDAAVAAFTMLAGTLLTKDGNAHSLEDLVQIMLRPMLKGWLDENLPSLVERLVQDEIERISRGRR